MTKFADKCLFTAGLNRAARVLAGVSGGADSLALLLVLASRKYPVEAIHFEHGIRGAAGAADAAATAKFCRDRDLPCRVIPLDVPSHLNNGENLEAAARRLRLEAWHRLAVPGDVVALGHHLNDAEENFLLRFARGGNLSSLTNLRPEKQLEGLTFVRPLLHLTRREIEAFLKKNGVESWCVDATNADVAYQRNFLRHSVLGEWIKRFPAAAGGFSASLSNLELDADFIEQTAVKTAAPIIGRSATRIEFWRTLHPALLPRVLAHYFGAGTPPSGRLLNGLKNWLAANGRGEFKLYDRAWRREGDCLTVGKLTSSAADAEITELIWNWRTTPELRTASGVFRIKTEIFSGADEKAPNRAIFDPASLPEELRLAPRRQGEKYLAFDGRTSTVKKLMIDAKIPASQRAGLPLLRTPDGTIIWLPGLANCGWFKAVPGAPAAFFQFEPSNDRPSA